MTLLYLVADDEVPLGLVLEDDVPLPIPPVVDDDELPVPLPDGELLEVPPMPELGLVLELDEPDGVVVVEEDEEPPGTTTVSRVVLVVEVLLGGVTAPPGITVVVSFFSHADKANAPTTAKSIPLRLIFTVLSSEKSLKIAHDRIAIAVPDEPLSFRCMYSHARICVRPSRKSHARNERRSVAIIAPHSKTMRSNR